jgi:2,4-dienoyl-CoA reductase-like NADH-dependent reductase (Old Yellow Enzyme family)
MKFAQDWTFGSGHRSINRIALAPMTNKQSGEDGQVSEEERAWLSRRAEGGFGMVITCASHVLPSAKGFGGQMGIFSDELLPGLEKVARSLHESRSLGVVQLYHGGVRSPSSLTGVQPISASDLPPGDMWGEGARAATEAEIEEVIEAFASAAQRAWKAGFAGIEVHGAHGYLITQFIDFHCNQRQDRWGGVLENRARLLLDIVKRIKQRVPRTFILGVRISPEAYQAGQGLRLEESLQLADWLDELGIDYLHVSLGDVLRKPIEAVGPFETTLEHFAQRRRRYALMVAGGVMDPEQAEQALARGADWVALGRAGIACADWPLAAQRPGFVMPRPPYTEEHLAAQGLGPLFIEYMKRWKGFVAGT